jgi:hypothetical protein
MTVYCDETNRNVATLCYRTPVNTSIFFLQVFSMAAPGYVADIQAIL